jgi:ABC-type transport system substrate-binding protein
MKFSMLKNFLLVLLLLSLSAQCTRKNEAPSGELFSYLDANVPNLDPIHSTNKYASTVTQSIFEGLYHYHYFKRPLEVEPLLAEAMPEISKDGLTYTIKLKKGVYFQADESFSNGKGKEVKAEDFIYSWKRLADPKNKGQGWWMLDGKIKGLNEWRELRKQGKADYKTPVEGLKALDPYTLQIKLNQRSYQFLHVLAAPPTVVVAKEVVENYGDQIGNHPVGTGPYRLVQWVRNSKIELSKHENYHKSFFPKQGNQDSNNKGDLEDAGKLLPLSDKVTIRIMTERQPLWLSFLKGKIDHGVIPKDNNDQILKENKIRKEYEQKGISIHPQDRPDVLYVGINMEDPVLGKHVNLRKAMNAAINRDLLIEKLYSGRGIKAQGPIPPSIVGYNENYKSPNNYDLRKAKSLMAEAGFPEGKGLPEFTLDLPNSDVWSKQFGEFLKDQWGQIGVKIKLTTNTWPQFDKKLKTKQVTLFPNAWMADYPDSENFLQLFYSKNISPGPNSLNFSNEEFDKMFEKFLTLPPGKERYELTQKMVKLINEHSPALFTLHRSFRLPYHGWLKNYNEYPIIYDYLKYLRVDEDVKKELIKKL